MKNITWHSGSDDFIRHTFTPGVGQPNKLVTEILDVETENLDLVQAFAKHVADRQTRNIEVLYSGGLDSELVIRTLQIAKLPVVALTLELRVQNITINAHDLYYADKYCRENNVLQRKVVLDIDRFFGNGDHIAYLAPYHGVQPNIAAQFWLLEQASGFPVIGGDWPWLQTHVAPRRLSPWRLDFVIGDRFMRDRGIHGINNMISHSLDSCMLLVNEHYKIWEENKDKLDTQWRGMSYFKYALYKRLGVLVEPLRLKAYGWDLLDFDKTFFDLEATRKTLVAQMSSTDSQIIWNDKISQAGRMLPGSHDQWI